MVLSTCVVLNTCAVLTTCNWITVSSYVGPAQSLRLCSETTGNVDYNDVREN